MHTTYYGSLFALVIIIAYLAFRLGEHHGRQQQRIEEATEALEESEP